MGSYKTFNGITEFGHAQATQQLEAGLYYFLNYAFLGIGAFDNITRPTSGVYGGQPYQLRPVQDPYFSDGQVWQGFRSNWVYESGIEYHTQPINISGVYVNSTFYPTATTGTYSHYVNYPDGRVVFNSPISTTSNVQLNYSYRNVLITTEDTPWFKEILFNSYRSDINQFTSGSGIMQMLGQNRVQLPAVVIETVKRRDFQGYQLGGGQYMKGDALLHVFAETKFDRDNITDILSFMSRKTTMLVDLNSMSAATGFPLDYRGTLVSNARSYPQLISDFFWRSTWWESAIVQSMGAVSPNLWTSVVRVKLNTVMHEI